MLQRSAQFREVSLLPVNDRVGAFLRVALKPATSPIHLDEQRRFERSATDKMIWSKNCRCTLGEPLWSEAMAENRWA